MRCYKRAAEMNCPTAMNNLGLMLEGENLDEAVELYRSAHKLGNLDATVNFALAYIKVIFVINNFLLERSRCIESFTVSSSQVRPLTGFIVHGRFGVLGVIRDVAPSYRLRRSSNFGIDRRCS